MSIGENAAVEAIQKRGNHGLNFFKYLALGGIGWEDIVIFKGFDCFCGRISNTDFVFAWEFDYLFLFGLGVEGATSAKHSDIAFYLLKDIVKSLSFAKFTEIFAL